MTMLPAGIRFEIRSPASREHSWEGELLVRCDLHSALTHSARTESELPYRAWDRNWWDSYGWTTRDDFVGANGFIDIRVGAPRGFNGYQNRGLSSGSKADVVTGFLVPTERSETRQVDGRTGCCI